MSHTNTNTGDSRLAELDGLRALAVLSVILFHCEISGVVNAGFFGVDIFFTISGFIITAILLKEYHKDGSFRFLNFYFRRLKRLMPPVLAMALLAIVVTMQVSPGALSTMYKDLPAALFYYSNWWQIVDSQDYFDNTPHVLKHLWSLAVEEQFYFLWPPIAYLVLRKWGTRKLGMAALALAVLSTAWMAFLYQMNMEAGEQNRIYLGTDTHAMGLLAGAALACFWNPWKPRERSRRARFASRVLALLSLAGLLYLIQTMTTADPAMYRGLFLLVPALTCVVIQATTGDRSFFLSAVLRDPITQWLGTRSYSLYLVHWPVFVWMRLLGHADFSNWLVLAAALGIVALVSELLYRIVEAPSMHLFNLKNPTTFPKALFIGAYVIFAGLFTWAAMYEVEQEAALQAERTAARQAEQPKPVAAPVAEAPVPDDIGPGEPIAGGEDIYAMGDSVLLGAKLHLTKAIPGIRVDAKVGRQASEGLKVVREWRGHGGKASTVLVHLGTNGYINEGQFRDLLADLADRKAVIVVNVRADRRWTVPNNDIIGRVAKEFPNTHLIDWNALSARRPEFFVKDGIHLTQKGIFALSAQIKRATGGTVLPPGAAATAALASAAEPAKSEAPLAHKVAAQVAEKPAPAGADAHAAPPPAPAPEKQPAQDSAAPGPDDGPKSE